MAKLNQFASQAYDYLLEGASAIKASVQRIGQNVQEAKILEQDYVEQLRNVSALIGVQEAQVQYLATYPENALIQAEIAQLQGDLDTLAQQRQELEAALQQLQALAPSLPTAPTDTPLMELQHQLKALLADNKIQEALEGIRQHLPPNSAAYNQSVLFSAKLRSTEQQKALGLLSVVDYDLLHSRLLYGVLELVNGLEEGEIIH